jgi:hypothetical protein
MDDGLSQALWHCQTFFLYSRDQGIPKVRRLAEKLEDAGFACE